MISTTNRVQDEILIEAQYVTLTAQMTAIDEMVRTLEDRHEDAYIDGLERLRNPGVSAVDMARIRIEADRKQQDIEAQIEALLELRRSLQPELSRALDAFDNLRAEREEIQ